jgi:CelD/BcsL family acetyltransferase involved in cellulose biosynthesis
VGEDVQSVTDFVSVGEMTPMGNGSGPSRCRTVSEDEMANLRLSKPSRLPAGGWAGMDRFGLMQRVGPLALVEGAEWLDRVHDKAGVSLLARRQWLQSWADAFSGWEPWVLALVDDDGVRAVAPLARRRVRWGVEVVSMGDNALAESPVAACDDAAAVGLAAALVAQLSTTVVFPGAPRPEIRFADDRPPTRWLTRNTGSALAKARNRISREGHRLEVGWVETWGKIEDVLPELVMVHRARDMELRGATLLDDAQEACFYHHVIQRHAGHWRLLAVRIDESLAAYVLCLKDGSTLRVWDNRVAPGWRRYSAGLIGNAEVVLRAATDGFVDVVDWGCGEQRYKTSLSNDVVDAQILMAWSSPVLRAALACQSRMAAGRASLMGAFQVAGGPWAESARRIVMAPPAPRSHAGTM